MKAFKKLKSLFPLKVKITKKILKKADLHSNTRCIGARALRKALGKNFKDNMSLLWSTDNGYIKVFDKKKSIFHTVIITTPLREDLTGIFKPKKIKFIIYKPS